MRIFFFGNGNNYLSKLFTANTVVSGVMAVEREPDWERCFGSIVKTAKQNNIPVWDPDKLLSADFRDFLLSNNFDLFIVKGFNRKIPNSIFNLPQFGSLNIHESLLPKYRSRHPINWAIINGEKCVGITIHKMDEGFDTGPILLQSLPIQMSINDNYLSIHQKVNREGESLLLKSIDLLKTGRASFTLQNHESATYYPPRKPGDGRIEWNRASEEVHNLVRALVYPYPGAFTVCNAKKWIVRESALCPSWTETQNAVSGEVLRTDTAKGVLVKTGKGVIRIIKVQCEGSEPIAAEKASAFQKGSLLGK